MSLFDDDDEDEFIPEKDVKRIGGIANYYGCLNVAEKDGKFYWSIENYSGHYWEEISLALYQALIKEEENK